jgi:hypothetical protein
MSGVINLIARRLLTFVMDGHLQEAQVGLGMPYEDNGAFVCPYQIVIGNESTGRAIVGFDGIQALQLAMFMVGSSLRSMSGASDGRCGNEAGMRFPSTLNDLLSGERGE